VSANAVERYGDEAPLGYVQATVVQSAIARTAPKGGGEVTLLVGGTDVAQVAERGSAILVMFSDPAEPAREEMGWIRASAIHPALPSRCPARQVAVVTALGSFCSAPCRGAPSCGADEACVPAGTATKYAGRITNFLSYCVAR
jgi:hypothetical protein